MKRTAFSIAAALYGAAPAVWGAQPVGGEFHVNTFSTHAQAQPRVAASADGRFVVAWASTFQDGDAEGIYAQPYDANGKPVGPEIRVNVVTTLHQAYPAVAMSATGAFVVAWSSNQQDGSGFGAYARLYNAKGVPQTSEFQVNDVSTGEQGSLAVAMDASGDFVVAFEAFNQTYPGSDVYARRYDAAGIARDAQAVRVNFETGGWQAQPSVAMDATGDYVVTWNNSGAYTGETSGVWAQRFAANGTRRGTTMPVNVTTTGNQYDAYVAMDADGNFVVSWTSEAQDGDDTGVYARVFGANGVPRTNEFRVNLVTTGPQVFPKVAMDARGNFAFAWSSSDSSETGVFARQYSADGLPTGGQFRINQHTTSYQDRPSVALDADGDFVAAWHGYAQEGGIFEGHGIYARRYRGPEDVNLVLTQFDSSDPANAGQPLTYTMRVTNRHAQVDATTPFSIDRAIGVATGVRVTGTLPADTTGATVQGNDWICSLVADQYDCRYALLLRAGEKTTPILLSVIPGGAEPSITNAAKVSANQTDTRRANNQSLESTGVLN